MRNARWNAKAILFTGLIAISICWMEISFAHSSRSSSRMNFSSCTMPVSLYALSRMVIFDLRRCRKSGKKTFYFGSCFIRLRRHFPILLPGPQKSNLLFGMDQHHIPFSSKHHLIFLLSWLSIILTYSRWMSTEKWLH